MIHIAAEPLYNTPLVHWTLYLLPHYGALAWKAQSLWKVVLTILQDVRQVIFWLVCLNAMEVITLTNKKAQLSLTNPRDAKACQNCSNSTCLQRCHWQYWPIFMRLTAIASEIREIPRNSLKVQTYGVQGHPRSSILVSIESPCTTSY